MKHVYDFESQGARSQNTEQSQITLECPRTPKDLLNELQKGDS